MSKSSARQFLVKVAGIDGYFATKTGGNITADATKVYDGGTTKPDVIAGPPTADDITVTRPYDPNRDAPILARLRQQVSRFTATVSVTPTDRDLVAVADPTVYADALLIGITEPEANSGSGDPSTYELTFSPGSFK